MGRICIDCGRRFDIGSYKYNNCKECRYRTVVIMNTEPSPIVTSNLVQSSYSVPIQQHTQTYVSSQPSITYQMPPPPPPQPSYTTYVQTNPTITYSTPVPPPPTYTTTTYGYPGLF